MTRVSVPVRRSRLALVPKPLLVKLRKLFVATLGYRSPLGVGVVSVMAMLAMSAGSAAAGSKPTSMLNPGLNGSESVSVQGLKNHLQKFRGRVDA